MMHTNAITLNAIARLLHPFARQPPNGIQPRRAVAGVCTFEARRSALPASIFGGVGLPTAISGGTGTISSKSLELTGAHFATGSRGSESSRSYHVLSGGH